MQPTGPSQPAAAGLRERYASLFQSPDLLPWQLDLPGRRLLLALVDESVYHSASFLDQRLNQDGRLQALWAPLDTVLADHRNAGPMTAPAGFIFHVGHCGSTLLSRLLGQDRRILPLREPLSLRSLAEAERLLGTPASSLDREGWQATSGLLLRLLTRSYRDGQRALIKPSSNCNNLMLPLLSSHPGHRAVFLYLNLKSYLANVLRPQARGALHSFAADRAHESQRALPGLRIPLPDLSPARLGAVNWATSMARLLEAQADARVATQVRTLEFEAFLADPAANLADLFRFLDAPLDRQAVERLLTEGQMGRYAKDQSFAYTPEVRAADLEQSMRQHAADIEDARCWLSDLLAATPRLASLQAMINRD